MSVAVTYRSDLTVVETLETNVPYASAADKTVTHNGLNTTNALTGASSPPVTKVAAFQQAMTAGAATIDLTALPGTNGATESFNGLKVQFAKFRNKATNANAITIVGGASNGYDLLGAGWSITLAPGQEALFKLNDASPDVAGGDKTIDISGTLAQVLEVELVAG